MNDINELKKCINDFKKSGLSKKLVTDYKFSELTIKINNKETINFFSININKLLSLLNINKKLNKIDMRIFMTSFVIFSFPEIVINNPNLADLNKKIILLNRKLLNAYDNMLCISEMNNSYLKAKINIFINNLFKFIAIFNIWKAKDKKDLLNEFIKIYLELESSSINLDKFDTNYKKTFIENCKNEKDSIKKKIFMIAGNSGLDYFSKTLEEIQEFQNNIQQIYEDTKNIVQKAFWNSLEEKINLDKPDYCIILPILDDLIKMLCFCVPKRLDIHYEINGCIDLELLKQMIEHDAINIDDVFKIIKYSISLLEKFQPHSFDKETKIWSSNLFSEFENETNLGKLLKNFFRYIFDKLELIIIEKNDFETTPLYKTIKENKR